jgi:hypothetical protein
MRKASPSSAIASKEVSLTLIGAIMSFEENTQQQSKAVTSHYWGYRELTTDEINAVGGGGDFSGDGFNGNDGYAAASGVEGAFSSVSIGEPMGMCMRDQYTTQTKSCINSVTQGMQQGATAGAALGATVGSRLGPAAAAGGAFIGGGLGALAGGAYAAGGCVTGNQ